MAQSFTEINYGALEFNKEINWRLTAPILNRWNVATTLDELIHYRTKCQNMLKDIEAMELQLQNSRMKILKLEEEKIELVKRIADAEHHNDNR